MTIVDDVIVVRTKVFDYHFRHRCSHRILDKFEKSSLSTMKVENVVERTNVRVFDVVGISVVDDCYCSSNLLSMECLVDDDVVEFVQPFHRFFVPVIVRNNETNYPTVLD